MQHSFALQKKLGCSKCVSVVEIKFGQKDMCFLHDLVLGGLAGDGHAESWAIVTENEALLSRSARVLRNGRLGWLLLASKVGFNCLDPALMISNCVHEIRQNGLPLHGSIILCVPELGQLKLDLAEALMHIHMSLSDRHVGYTGARLERSGDIWCLHLFACRGFLQKVGMEFFLSESRMLHVDILIYSYLLSR